MKYIHHRKRGIKVPLHIRELKADRITVGAGAYTFLGTANYVKHDGSRPMKYYPAAGSTDSGEVFDENK